MNSFNRERFLYWLLGAVLGVNALFFGFGLFSCSRADNPKEQCPEIGKRFDSYSEKALAAVLGLIAGAGAVSLSQKQVSSVKAEPKKPDKTLTFRHGYYLIATLYLTWSINRQGSP